jgi:transcriptional repressor NrdR
VKKACQGRPVSDQDLAQLAQKVEETIRQTGSSQVDANDIGLSILDPLRELDEVAYLRFASVYQAFENLEDFEEAIGLLRESTPISEDG